MAKSPKGFFAQCNPCGARWRIGSVDMEIGVFASRVKATRCPYCDAGPSQYVMCPTDGPGAVTRGRGPTKAAAPPSRP